MRITALLWLFFLVFSCKESVVLNTDKSIRENALAKENSPYLLQHKHNPVDWLPWGAEALAVAKQRNVPIIISIGYSTCHWCHVMAHEVFEDKECADWMNKHFVCIKVDREERPEVDEIYMTSLHIMGRQGGWPLNMFATPDGKPFWGGTYFPREHWLRILQEISTLWQKDHSKIVEATQDLMSALAEQRDHRSAIDENVWSQMESSLKKEFDNTDPAWSDAPKFPPSQKLRLVLLLKAGKVSETLKQQAVQILTTMQDSGLHDLVGGGFHRYSTDTEWRVPHFEKMLYDNALLAIAYLIAGKQYQRQDLTRTGLRTLDYLLRDCRVSDANGHFLGYASAEDADDPMGEGSFYAWTPQQLTEVLGKEIGEKLAQAWNIRLGLPKQNHLGHNEPITTHIPFPRGAVLRGSVDSLESIQLRTSWEQYYPKLLAVRAKRPRPGRDDKVLTEWNALALSAFAHAARLTNDENYLHATKELAQLLMQRYSENGLLRLPQLPGFINDYGFLLCGLLDAYDTLGNPELVQTAQKIAEQAIKRFAHPQGGFYATEERPDLIHRSQILFDNAYPAGNSMMALGLVRLWNITAEQRYYDYAQGSVNVVGKLATRAVGALGTLLTAHLMLQRGHLTIVVTGHGVAKDELLQVARKNLLLATVVDVEQAKQQPWQLLQERRELNEVMAFVCLGQTCLAPARTTQELQDRLATLEKMVN